MTDRGRLEWALFLSVLLHALLLTLLPFIRRAQLQIPTPKLIDVDVFQPAAKPRRVAPPAAAVPAQPAPAPPAIPVPKQQIVSPPEQGEEKEPSNTRFLSDRNNTVKEETVRHGQPAAGDPDAKPKPPQQLASAKPETRPKPAPPPRVGADTIERRAEARAALPRLDQLLPPAGDIIASDVGKPAEAAPKPAQQHASIERQDLLSHGDPWKSGGIRGSTMDLLPSIREGDVTLLNTKAEQFAPFVRRVAVRVLENFEIMLRRNSGSQGQSGEESVVIEAVMDKKGQLLSLTTKERSVLARMATDRSLESAVREGFFDRNPPPGAEGPDGKIHFVFETRLMFIVDPSGRRGVGWQGVFGTALL